MSLRRFLSLSTICKIFSQYARDTQNWPIRQPSPLLNRSQNPTLQRQNALPTTDSRHNVQLHFPPPIVNTQNTSAPIRANADALSINTQSPTSSKTGSVQAMARTKVTAAREKNSWYAKLKWLCFPELMYYFICVMPESSKQPLIHPPMANIQAFKKTRHFLAPEAISPHLRCSICQDVFQDPMRTICGHTFCYLCIQSWAKVKKTCPMCKESIGKRALERDLIAYNLVDELPALCVHGCHWQGPYSFAKKHQRECPQRPIKDSTSNPNSIYVELPSDWEEDVIMMPPKREVVQVDLDGDMALPNLKGININLDEQEIDLNGCLQ